MGGGRGGVEATACRCSMESTVSPALYCCTLCLCSAQEPPASAVPGHSRYGSENPSRDLELGSTAPSRQGSSGAAAGGRSQVGFETLSSCEEHGLQLLHGFVGDNLAYDVQERTALSKYFSTRGGFPFLYCELSSSLLISDLMDM